jgi:hypothetical protein
MQAYSDTFELGHLDIKKPRSVVEEIDTVILAADANKNVIIFHSPKNFGGTRTRPGNKLIRLIGLGAQATWAQTDLRTALTNCNIIVPKVDEIAGCTTAQEVNDILIPDKNGVVNFKGSAIFAPAPAHRNAILATNTRDPFELIPMLTRLAIEFDEAVEDNEERNGTATTHADDLNAWLYGVKRGLIPETRYTVIPEDNEAAIFFNNRHAQCITNARRGGLVQGGAVANNDAILQQLTASIAAQGKATTETNDLCRIEIQRQQTREENKKGKWSLVLQQHIPQTKTKHSRPPSLVSLIATTLVWRNMTSSISLTTLGTWTSHLHQGQPKHFTWESFFMRIQAPQVTSQFLHSTNKSQI